MMTDTAPDDALNLDAVDQAALERSMEIAKRDPGRADQLEFRLRQGEPWIEVAEYAVCLVQTDALNLKPWECPPCEADEDGPTPRDPAAQTLLRRMLRAGVSRYDPDPLAALQRAKRRRVKT